LIIDRLKKVIFLYMRVMIGKI